MFLLFQCCGWALWLLCMLEMDSWRQKFIDARDRLEKDDDDDDFALRWSKSSRWFKAWKSSKCRER